jgi:hypothetical protein
MDTKSLLLQSDCTSDLNRPAYDPNMARRSSPMYIPAASSPECIEAQRLLGLTAQACRRLKHESPPTSSEDSDPHSPSQGAGTVAEVISGMHAKPADSSLLSHEHWSMIEPPARTAQRAACMTSSGSFTDALALLLRSRTSQPGAPPSPAEASHRSGLSVSVSNQAASMTPSPEPSQDRVDDRWPQSDNGAAHSAAAGAQVNGLQKLPEMPEDPAHSVNAGVAWQFGDRILPADLLRECAPYLVSSWWNLTSSCIVVMCCPPNDVKSRACMRNRKKGMHVQAGWRQ